MSKGLRVAIGLLLGAVAALLINGFIALWQSWTFEWKLPGWMFLFSVAVPLVFGVALVCVALEDSGSPVLDIFMCIWVLLKYVLAFIAIFVIGFLACAFIGLLMTSSVGEFLVIALLIAICAPAAPTIIVFFFG